MSACLRYGLCASLLWLGVTLALFPGLMSPDALFQYAQVRSGQISNWHPPIMVYLWQALEPFVKGPAALYLLAMVGYGLAVITLCFQLFSGFWMRLGACILLSFPAPLAILMSVWKDSLLIATLMGALSLLVWTQRRYHPLKLLGGMALLTLACLLRHNAILALLPLIWLYLAARAANSHEPAKRSTRLSVPQAQQTVGEKLHKTAARALDNSWCRAAYVLIIAALMTSANGLVNSGTHKASPWPMVAVWDLAAISLEKNEMLIPEIARHPSADLATARRLFSPTGNVSLCQLDEGVRKFYCVEKLPLRTGKGIAPEDVSALLRAWVEAILTHPEAYLKHRFNLMLHLFDIQSEEGAIGFNIASLQPDALQGEWYNGPSAEMLGMTRFAEPSALGQQMIEALVWLRAHTPLLSPWFYLACYIGVWAVLLLRHCERPKGARQSSVSEIVSSASPSRNDGFVIALLLSAALMAAPLFVIVPNYQLRYLIWPILCTNLVMLNVFQHLLTRRDRS